MKLRALALHLTINAAQNANIEFDHAMVEAGGRIRGSMCGSEDEIRSANDAWEAAYLARKDASNTHKRAHSSYVALYPNEHAASIAFSRRIFVVGLVRNLHMTNLITFLAGDTQNIIVRPPGYRTSSLLKQLVGPKRHELSVEPALAEWHEEYFMALGTNSSRLTMYSIRVRHTHGLIKAAGLLVYYKLFDNFAKILLKALK